MHKLILLSVPLRSFMMNWHCSRFSTPNVFQFFIFFPNFMFNMKFSFHFFFKSRTKGFSNIQISLSYRKIFNRYSRHSIFGLEVCHNLQWIMFNYIIANAWKTIKIISIGKLWTVSRSGRKTLCSSVCFCEVFGIIRSHSVVSTHSTFCKSIGFKTVLRNI